MSNYKYTSSINKKNSVFPLSPYWQLLDKKEAALFLREKEKLLASIISNSNIPDNNYYIFGNDEIIACTNTYDNAMLIAEAFTYYSIFYKNIGLMSREGLLWYYETSQINSKRRNHVPDVYKQ